MACMACERSLRGLCKADRNCARPRAEHGSLDALAS
jgi:hypothetical protein